MITLVAVPEHKIATYDSQAAQLYFKGIHDDIETVRIRSAEEIVEEFWHLWAGLVPSRMSVGLVKQIMAESPELPADKDPSTYEFMPPEQ